MTIQAVLDSNRFHIQSPFPPGIPHRLPGILFTASSQPVSCQRHGEKGERDIFARSAGSKTNSRVMSRRITGSGGAPDAYPHVHVCH